ncbi:MAG TPA: DUF4126 domain-containing protein [Vicinamibacterales bacterium]
MTPESLLSIAAGLALAASAGFRVFVPLLVVSVAARTGWLAISPTFEWIATTPALTAFATATVVEIGAYYVPFLDNLLDTVSTPAAVVAGMIASASVLVDVPPWLQYSIAIAGAGSTAGVVAASTTMLRLKSSALTAGLGNAVLATFELFGAFGVALVAVLVPILALVMVAAIFAFVIRRLGRRSQRRRVPTA